MALQQRFVTTAQGALVVIGNTLTIWGTWNSDPSSINTAVETSALISTDLRNQVSGFPVGTTLYYTKASSSAQLVIPSSSKILFAQLIWICSSPSYGTQNNPIKFITPVGTNTIYPDIELSQDDGIGHRYWRAADVKNLVQIGGIGTYSCEEIPTGQLSSTNIVTSTWTLIVVYENINLPFRYFNINTGLQASSVVQQAIYNFTSLTDGETSLYKNAIFGDSGEVFIISECVQVDINSETSNSDKIIFYSLTSSGYIDFNTTLSYSFTPAIGAIPVNKAMTLTRKTLIINNANVISTSSVDKSFSDINDKITKTILLNNTGTTIANNVTVIDTIPNGASFVTNSLMVNGTVRAGANTSSGYNIGSIQVGVTTVTYQITVTTIPSTNSISTIAIINYFYTVDPATPNAKSKSITSNSVSTQVKHVDLSSSMSADKSSALVGSVITYTVPLRVIGNTDAINVAFTSNIPTGTSFVSNSVKINGAIQSGVNATNISIGTIAMGQTTTITFDITVNSVPPGGSVVNSGNISYAYTVDPVLPGSKSSVSTTNTVAISISNLTINASKSADKSGVEVGKNINYTVAISNTGSVNINNVKVLDTIPSGTSLVANSITINGNAQSGSNPNPPMGISVGTINGGSTTTVVFAIKVDTKPPGGNIANSAMVAYNYTANPLVLNGESGSSSTNTVLTSVIQSGLFATKSVDKTGGTLGDILNYTIAISNSGDVQVTNVNIIDTIPNGGSLVQNSVTLNGSTQSGASLSNFIVNSIGANSTVTVTFQVKVDFLPTSNSFINSAYITYNYTVDPSNPGGASGNVNTNSVTTSLGQATIVATKSSNKSGAGLDDDITYVVGMKNTGNLVANQVMLVDTIPEGTSFVSNSVVINGTSLLGSNPNPPNGISIGNLSAGQATTISFRVNVVTIPTLNLISNVAMVGYKYSSSLSSPQASGLASTNIVTIPINSTNLTVTKTADKMIAKIGDEITYTISISNSGNTAANSISFIDTIPNGATFVVNSVFVNGVNRPLVNTSPPSGVVIQSIAAGSTASILFKVTVATLPTTGNIVNNGILSYYYTADPSVPNGGRGAVITNSATTSIVKSGVTAVKSSDKNGATIGEEISYFIVIKNTGNVSIDNVSVIDTLPSGVTFVQNSFQVDGATKNGENPSNPAGALANNIPSGGTSTVNFKVTVTTTPAGSSLSNSAYISYKYALNPSNPSSEIGGSNTNVVNTTISNVSLNASKVVDKIGATIGDELNYSIVINNTGNVRASSVVVIDTLPEGLNFVNNSIKINGATASGATVLPPFGVGIGNIDSSKVSTVTFKTIVSTIPLINPIQNKATVGYKYVVDVINSRSVSNTVETNTTNTNISKVNLTLIKSVDKVSAAVGEIIVYTIDINNPSNVDANDVILIDTIPQGISIDKNSVVVTGVINPIVTILSIMRIEIGTITAGNTSKVTFNAKVISRPTLAPIENLAYISYKYTLDPSIPNGGRGTETSNKTITNVGEVKLNVVKLSDKVGATIGDEINYTVVIKSMGNLSATDLIIIDTIPEGTELVSGSFKVNQSAQTGVILSEPGYNIGATCC